MLSMDVPVDLSRVLFVCTGIAFVPFVVDSMLTVS